jgi:polyisoprenoid-binding protein YceI
VLWASLNTASSAEPIKTFDSKQSSALFQVGMRLPIPVNGRFPEVDGEIIPLPDKQIRVRVHLDARSLKMSGKPWIQSLTHSSDFLDTSRYPDIVFFSDDEKQLPDTWHSVCDRGEWSIKPQKVRR